MGISSRRRRFPRYSFMLQVFICCILEGANCLDLPQSPTQCEIPFSTCATPATKESALVFECRTRNWRPSGRCCYDENNCTVGLDAASCNLSSLEGHPFTNYTQLIILDLQNNQLNATLPDDYLGLVSLQTLFLDDGVSCPGQWLSENVSSVGGVNCSGKIDPCLARNVSCDENGVCSSLGPGLARCGCKDGFYGYRCLRKGDFPVTAFAVGLVLPFAALSTFVWVTQRRHVKVQ